MRLGKGRMGTCPSFMLKIHTKILIFDFPHPSSRFAANPILRIHIRTSSNGLFGGFDVYIQGSFVNQLPHTPPAPRLRLL